MRADGATLGEIAKVLGVGRTTVARHLENAPTTVG
jgi:DNA-binding CsgD family transcriptional regulator